MMATIQVDRALADRLLKDALAYCAKRHSAGDAQRTLLAVHSGQEEVCECLLGALTTAIADVLGKIDKTVKSVYAYKPVTSLESNRLTPDAEHSQAISINLVVWVERKSAALQSLVSSLEKDLIASQRQYGCLIGGKGTFSLSVAMVDDQDVKQQHGFGTFIGSQYLRSSLIWSRPKISSSTAPISSQSEKLPSIQLPNYFDPEIMPVERLIEHARTIEKIPPEERVPFEPHLMELKVILIPRMISDQLGYIDIAKNWLTVEDLWDILQHRIGNGKIGGKSAGMLLAARIINQVADEETRASIHIPESYFLGSDLIYIFMAMNGLIHWNDQKHKSEEQIWEDYPLIQEEFQRGKLPPEVIAELGGILENIGNKPLIVRSSSQLEDNFGTSFAGKYDSFFCPNQGTPQENLKALTNAIARTYASTLKPEALLYRRNKGLQDYDERMAVLIQVVQGEVFDRYFLPQASGVAFSRNLYRWSPRIKREDGFARLVWGLGTRAVQRVADDYPRLVALSHPTLQPDDSAEAIRHYSQRYVDLIDLEDNAFKTLPVHEVLTPRYPMLRLIAQLEQDGFFISPRMRVSKNDIPRLAITYHEFLQRTNFAPLLSRVLKHLEEHYHGSVDLEFTVRVPNPREINPRVQISLLQCRPQSYLVSAETIPDIEDVPEDKIVFSTRFMVPRGYLPDIRYVIYVPPSCYLKLPSKRERYEVGKLIARLNSLLEEKTFICVGPGRWGSMDIDLGVFVSYTDIDNAGALIELAGKGIGPAPEPSLGTHFFQDLMEAHIFPLAIPLDKADSRFDWDFFEQAPNQLPSLLPDVPQALADCVRLINVDESCSGCHLEIVMDDERGEATAYLAQPADNKR